MNREQERLSVRLLTADVSYRIEIRAPDKRWQLWSTPDSNHAERTFSSVCDAYPGARFRLIRHDNTRRSPRACCAARYRHKDNGMRAK